MAAENDSFTSASFFESQRETFQAASNRAGSDKALNQARSCVERDASKLAAPKKLFCIRGRIFGDLCRDTIGPVRSRSKGAWRHPFEETNRAESKVEYEFGSGRTYSLLDSRPNPRQRATRQADRSIKAE
jgi:hypothetical protein